MPHRNAPLTAEGRRRLCERVDRGRPKAHVAAEAGVSRQCVWKWHTRWLAEGEAGLLERSSRPERSPNRIGPGWNGGFRKRFHIADQALIAGEVFAQRIDGS